MTPLDNFARTLCVLYFALSSGVWPLQHGKGRQHFVTASSLRSDGGFKDAGAASACCLRRTVYAAPVGLSTAANAFSPKMQPVISPERKKATLALLPDPSFFLNLRKYSTAKSAVSRAIHSPTHPDTGPQRSRFFSHSLKNQLRHLQPAFMSFLNMDLYQKAAFARPSSPGRSLAERDSLTWPPQAEDGDSIKSAERDAASHFIDNSSATQNSSFNEETAVHEGEQEQWYAIRTNFPPRYLRILAKKSEGTAEHPWYTVLTNFKPHVLKLTPE